MSFPRIHFKKITARKERIATLTALKRWIADQELDQEIRPLKKEVLTAIIEYAQSRFVDIFHRPTDASRMEICETIFIAAPLPQEKFLEEIVKKIKAITDSKSELRKIINDVFAKHPQESATATAALEEKDEDVAGLTRSSSFVMPLRKTMPRNLSSVHLPTRPATALSLPAVASTPAPSSTALVIAQPSSSNSNSALSPVISSAVPTVSASVTSSAALVVLASSRADVSPIASIPSDWIANLSHLNPFNQIKPFKKGSLYASVNPISVDEKDVNAVIAGFKAETSGLMALDENIPYVAFLGFLGYVALSRCLEEDSSFKLIYCSLLFMVLSGMLLQRNQLMASQQQKLSCLLSAYNRLAGSSVEQTKNPRVIQIFSTIAPFLQQEELAPWVNRNTKFSESFSGVSSEFEALLGMPPHSIYLVQSRITKPLIEPSIIGTLFGIDRMAENMRQDINRKIEEENEEKRQEILEKSKSDVNFKLARWLYGRPAITPPEIKVTNQYGVWNRN